jgi:tyrosine-protein kinase Etk/Wzc
LEARKNIQPAADIDFNKLLIIVKTHWLWIALLFVTINFAAYLFIRYTKNLYESESELKLDVKSTASDLGIKGIMDDNSMNLIAGEIEMIKSKLFLNRVLDNSNFEVSFFSVGRVLSDEQFGKAPAFITHYTKNHNLYNYPISFDEVDDKTYTLQPGKTGKPITARYGETVSIDKLELVLERNPDYQKGDEIGYYFTINSRDVLLNYLSRNLNVVPLSFSANTIRISFKDHNPWKAQAILNKVDTLYLHYSNEQKNLVNKQKIDWLTNELRGIEKKMEDFENYFEDFTIENRSNNIEEDLRTTILAINKIDSQRFDLTRRMAVVNDVADGLKIGKLIPEYSLAQYLPANTTQAIVDLQRLDIEQQRLKLSYSEKTFAYKRKQQEREALSEKVFAHLKEIKIESQKKLGELNKRKTQLEIDFANLPDKNTEFAKNKRFYKLYEEFYLTLMQSKSEFEIAEAGTVPDFKILSPATLPSVPISPKPLMIGGIGAVASLVTVLFVIGLLYLANNKITNLYELEKIDSSAILGAVPMSKYQNGKLHILEHPKSMVSEAIRSLRTNLEFFNISTSQKVVAISSTVSGEGKSFIAMNLGGVVALSKKKVVLLDLDMRKAKHAQPADAVDTTRGMSTILIRKHDWKECLTKTPMENFDFIGSGPHPPNPSELLLNGEFNQLLDELKKEYDFIILDTPPVGLVTDGIMAMKRADISIYVFRANYSKKEFMRHLQRIISINKFTNITTVLNAIPNTGKAYGYGYYEDNVSTKGLKSFFKS